MCTYFSGIHILAELSALIHECANKFDNNRLIENKSAALIHDYANKHLSLIFSRFR